MRIGSHGWSRGWVALATGLLLGACASAPGAVPEPAPVRTDTEVSAGVREQTADQQLHHVLNRLAFGPRPRDLEAIRRVGVDTWIEQQLHPERIANDATDEMLRRYRTLDYTAERLLAEFPPPAVALAAAARRANGPVSAEDSAMLRRQARQTTQALGELASSRVARAAMSERQLEEVMVEFWENHFNVFAGKNLVRYHLHDFDRTVRRHALGDFRALLGAVAKSPAMLYYLDNWQSVADSDRPTLQRQPRRARQRAQQRPQQRQRGLNENYARELMELHTLGVDGGYTQQDVIEVARALTGWTLERGAQGGGFVFRGQVHDAGAKTILGVKFPAGRGVEEGEAVLDLLAQHPKTAEFIATKLARRFVSDTPPPALVARAAGTFRRTRGNIREVVRTIVTSPEFFSADAYRAKVKTPFELVVSTLRILDVTPDETARTAQVVSRLGQPIYGHQAPNGYPDTGDAWMNTGAILNRINFGITVASDRLPGVRLAQWAPFDSLRALDRPAQVDGVIRALLGGAVSAETREILLSGTNPLAAETTGGANRGTGFAQIVGLALGAPEFQRR